MFMTTRNVFMYRLLLFIFISIIALFMLFCNTISSHLLPVPVPNNSPFSHSILHYPYVYTPTIPPKQ